MNYTTHQNSLTRKKDLFILLPYMYVYFAVRLYVHHVCVWHLERSEEDFSSPGTIVTGGC